MTSPPPLLLDVPLTAADSNSTTKTADSSGADAPADAPSTHHESRQFPAGGGAATHDCQPTPSPDGDSGSAHATVDTVPPPDATAADLAAKPATPASGSDTDDAHLTRRATCQPFTDGSTATRDCGPLPAPGIDGSSEHPLGTSHEVGVSSESSTAIFATTDRLATGTDGISDASPAAAGAVQPLSTNGQPGRESDAYDGGLAEHATTDAPTVSHDVTPSAADDCVAQPTSANCVPDGISTTRDTVRQSPQQPAASGTAFRPPRRSGVRTSRHTACGRQLGSDYGSLAMRRQLGCRCEGSRHYHHDG